MTKGFVYLVGAGPGRADLVTVRGAEVLNKADCIIYDKLANPALLKFARSDAEIIHVPKRIGKGSATQDQINQLILDKASVGRTVVRLKGGDPCMFGRAAEELAILAISLRTPYIVDDIHLRKLEPHAAPHDSGSAQLAQNHLEDAVLSRLLDRALLLLNLLQKLSVALVDRSHSTRAHQLPGQPNQLSRNPDAIHVTLLRRGVLINQYKKV